MDEVVAFGWVGCGGVVVVEVGGLAFEVVLGLADVVPEAVLKVVGVQLALLGQLREYLFLYHAETGLDALDYRFV